MRILLIEDCEHLAGFTKQSMEKEGFAVDIVLNGCPVLDYGKTFLMPTTEWGKTQFGLKRINIAYRRGFISVGGFRLGIKLFTEFHFYKPWESLSLISVPILIAHGTKDSMVPYSVARSNAEKAKNVSFISVEGADHGFEGYENRVFDEVNTWLGRHLVR